MEATTTQEAPNLLEKFVFMDKALKILDAGIKTEKNVILYGPGGHGKSELTLEFFYSKNINPYVITMGSGMTADRLFGGLNIPVFQNEGKIEYLVENSFMNHEFAIFEEMMDAPDYILEQLKDVLSSGVFRNGTQVYPIKTRFIVCCTNKTREEFAKNDSLKALMERFPLELNVVWDNYTEIAYNKLLETRFGEGTIDPMMPFLLQEYVKNGINISPRIALDAYVIYEECGPESLAFIAEFAKKPAIINDALKKFQSTVKFKEMGADIEEILNRLSENTRRSPAKQEQFIADFKLLTEKHTEIKKLTVNDDLAQVHAAMTKKVSEAVSSMQPKYNKCLEKISADTVSEETEEQPI